MSLTRLPFLTALLLAATSLGHLHAADSGRDKAERYLSALLKRPAPGAVFERFYDAWLSTGSSDELGAALAARAANSSAERVVYALYLSRCGKDVEALRQYTFLNAEQNLDPEIRLHQAMVAGRLLDFAAAITALDQGIATASGTVADRMHKLRGRMLVRMGQREAGIQEWQDLAASRPDDTDLQDDLLAVLVEEGLFKEAAERCEAATVASTDPYRKAVLGLRLGDILDRDGRRDEAIAAYAALLPQVGIDSWIEKEILAQIERVYRRDDDLTGLAAKFAELSTAEPQRSALRRRQVHILVSNGNTEEALSSFRDLLDHHPGDRTLRSEYADILAQAERPKEAADQIENILTENGDDPDLLLRLADLRHQAADDVAAKAVIQRYLKASPGGIAEHIRAANTLAGYALTDAARSMLENVSAAHPDDSEAALALAGFLANHEQLEAALVIYDRIAATGDTTALLRIVRELRDHEQAEHAFTLLHPHVRADSDDAVLLDADCSLGLELNHAAEVVPSARRRLYLTTTAPEMQRALDQLLVLVEAAETGDVLKAELEAQEHLAVADRCLLADLRERAGDVIGARALLLPTDTDRDEDAVILVGAYVRLLSGRQDWDAAAEALEALVARPGQRRPSTVAELVNVHRQRGDYPAALRWSEEWKQLAPSATEPWIETASIQRDAFDHEGALDTLRRAAIRFPETRDVTVHLAQAYLDNGRLDDARRIYWQLYENTDDVGEQLPWVRRLAELATEDGSIPTLIARFQERREGNRQALAPLLALAEIHAVDQNDSARREVLLEATRLRPDDVDLLREIARIETDIGEWEAALDTLRRAETIAGDPATRVQLAEVYFANGFLDEGLRLLEKISSDSGDPRVLESAALALASTANWEACAALIDRTAAHTTIDYRLAYLRAIVREEQQDVTGAKEAFFALLTPQPALSGPALPSSMGQYTQWMGEFRPILPMQSIELILQAAAQDIAYAYRDSSGRAMMMVGAGQGANPAAPTLPSDLPELRRLALAHLSTMIAADDEAAMASARDRLERAGIAYGDLILDLPGMQGFDDFLRNLDADTYENDHAIQSLRLLMRVDANGEGHTAEEATRLHTLFGDRYPFLACLAAIYGCNPELTKASLEKISQKGSPSDGALSMICQAIDAASNSAASEDDKAETNRLLREALFTWYPAIAARQATHPGPYGPWIIQQIIQTMCAEAEPVRILAFLDQEMAAAAARGPSRTPTGPMAMYMRHGNNESLITELTVPPESLLGIPSELLGVINQQDLESFVPLLDTVSNDLLAAVIAAKAEATEALNARLERLLKAETPSLDALLLGAAVACEHDDSVAVVAHLQKAAYLPMPRDVRQKVDGALIAYAMRHADDEPVRDAGRAAALRLRHGKLPSNERFALADALAVLGLEQESTRLEDEATRLANLTTTGNGASFQQQDVTEQITALIERDKADAAINLAVRQLRIWADGDLGLPQGQNANEWEVRRLREALSNAQLLDRVVERSAADAQANWRKQAEHARTLVHLDRIEEALVLHRKLQLERPEDLNLRTLTVTLLLQHKPDEARTELLALQPAEQSKVLEAWNETADNNNDIALQLAVAEACTDLVTSTGGGNDIEPQVIGQVVRALGGHIYIRGNQPNLPSLSSKAGLEPISENPLAQRRRDLYVKLTTALLDNQELAGAAFTRLYHLAEFGKGDLAPLEAMAPTILHRCIDPITVVRPPNPNAMWYSYPDDDHVGRFRSPSEVVVRQAWKSGTLAALSEEFASAITTPGGKQAPTARDEANRLSSILGLYTADEADYPKAAEVVLSTPVTDGSNFITAVDDPSAQDRETVILTCSEDRKLNVDLSAIAIAATNRHFADTNRHFNQSSIRIAQQWMMHLANNGSDTELRAFLGQFATALLGDGTTREKRIKAYTKAHQSRNWSNTEDISRVSTYLTTIGAAVERQPAMAGVMLSMIDADHPLRSEFMNSLSAGIRKPFDDKDATGAMAILRGSHLLDPAETFTDFSGNRLGNNSLFLTAVIAARNHDDFRTSMLAMLREEPYAQQFGAKILVAAINRDRNEFLAHVGSSLSPLQAWDKPKQQFLLSTLDEQFTARQEITNVDAIRAETWIATIRGENNISRVEEILAAKTWKDAKLEIYNFDDDLAPVLTPLISSNPEQVDLVLIKVQQLHERAIAQNQGSARFLAGDSLIGKLLSECLDRNDSPEMLAFVLQRILSSEPVAIRVGSDLRNELQQALNSVIQQLAAEGEDLAAALISEDFLLQKTGLTTDWIGLIPCLENSCRNLNEQDRISVQNAALQAEPGSAVWCVGLASLLGEEDRTPERDDQALQLLQAMSPLLQNDQSPLSWRLSAFGGIGDLTPEALLSQLDDVAQAGLALLDESRSSPEILSPLVMTAIANVWLAGDRAQEGWKERAITIIRDEFKRRTTLANSHRSGSTYGSSNDFESDFAFTRLAIAAEDMALARRIVTQNSSLEDEPAVWIALIRSGEYAFAERLMNEHLSKGRRSVKIPPYSEADQEVINGIRASEIDAAMRIIMETTIVSLSGPDDASRRERLRTYVSSLDLGQLSNPIHRSYVFKLLHSEAGDLFREMIATEARAIDLASVLTKAMNNNHDEVLEPLKLYLSDLLSTGDAEAVVLTDALIQQAVTAAAAGEDGLWSSAGKVLNTFDDWMRGDWRGRDERVLKNALAVARHLQSAGGNLKSPSRDHLGSDIVVLGLVTEGTEGVAAWHQQLQKEHPAAFKVYTTSEKAHWHRIREGLVLALVKGQAPFRKHKADIIAMLAALNDQHFAADDETTLLTNLVSNRLATWEELVAISSKEMGSHLRTAWSGELHEAVEGGNAARIARVASILHASLPADEPPLAMARLTLTLSRALIATGQHDQAVLILGGDVPFAFSDAQLALFRKGIDEGNVDYQTVEKERVDLMTNAKPVEATP